jgi:hypothetical protein
MGFVARWNAAVERLNQGLDDPFLVRVEFVFFHEGSVNRFYNWASDYVKPLSLKRYEQSSAPLGKDISQI